MTYLRTFGSNFSVKRTIFDLMSMDIIESAKQEAAYAAVDNYIESGFNVGVGSGSTVIYVVERISQKIKECGFKLRCVPTSYQSKQLLINSNIEYYTLESTPYLDVAIDGADEVDENLTLIKGGGGCHLQEKVVAASANKFIIVADYRKLSSHLGQNWKKGIPIEIIPMAYNLVGPKITEKFGGSIILREALAKAGPVISDNGNFIIDWMFEDQHNWGDVNQFIKMIPGVVETGLFVNMAEKAYFGMEDGSVFKRESSIRKIISQNETTI